MKTILKLMAYFPIGLLAIITFPIWGIGFIGLYVLDTIREFKQYQSKIKGEPK